jgi:hypothetical protein
MVAATATATLIDIDASPCPKTDRPKLTQNPEMAAYPTFLTARVHRMVSARSRQGSSAGGTKKMFEIK